ncbi:MAG TPA: adenylate/guanylate cyclase domain-containing protein [Sporichthyaceae bacterium]|jgi:class 3 adenylate cyclase|nr:adenylate/guanylate cyclase domain-containing protein [Sporichthyaceae bacterium]
MASISLRPASVPSAPHRAEANPEGEHKQVTVLFADVARSMTLAEELDLDDWADLMERLFDVCRQAIEDFGGTLDKFTGDGVMAVFGAPVAQEDHAARACHAGLRLVEDARKFADEVRTRTGAQIEVRVGLNSGEVVAGQVGNAFGAYTTVGHTVGLAQRMESLAELGTVYLSEHTARFLAGRFALRSLGATEVKGSSVPVGVFALEAARDRTAWRRSSGAARLIGRDADFGRLLAALNGAQEGRAAVVGLVGEAGSGKSRLCDELASVAEEAGFLVGRTAGVSHARQVPLLPVLGLLRDFYGVTGEEDPESIRAVVAASVLELGSSFEADLPLLFDFLEVPDPDRPAPQLGPNARRRRILDVFRRISGRRTERSALLFILEDLHWFDEESIAFLDGLFGSYPGTRTLVVTNFRPEFHAAWTVQSIYSQLPLSPLEPDAVDALLRELLGPGLEELAASLRERTGGNPFFAEEIVRSLAGDGTLHGEPGRYALARPVAEVRVPPTVHAVLAGRIDRLDPRDKSVLQAAAVIGRTVERDVLTQVTGLDPDQLAQALDALADAELLGPGEQAEQYRFRHPLTHEVAYRTLLAASRRRLHRAAARAIVESEPHRHDELAAVVALHFDAAGERLEAARWELRAGTQAIRLDYDEARRRWRTALDHLREVPRDEATLSLEVSAYAQLLRIGARTGMDPGERDELFARARPAAQRLGSDELLARLAISEATIRLWGGDVNGGLSAFRRAIPLAERSGNRDLLAFAHGTLAHAYAFSGPVSAAHETTEAALAVCAGDPATGRSVAGYSVYDAVQTWNAMAMIAGGRLAAARAVLDTALAAYEVRTYGEWHSWALSMSADLADATADPAEIARAESDAALAAALAQDSVTLAVRAGHATGLAALCLGRPLEASAAFNDALTLGRRHGTGLHFEVRLLADLARAHLDLDDHSGARIAATEATILASRQGARVAGALAHSVLARALRESATGADDLAAAAAAVAAGAALAAETGAATAGALLAEERARLEPDPTARHGLLKLAADGYGAIGAHGHKQRVRTELGG